MTRTSVKRAIMELAFQPRVIRKATAILFLLLAVPSQSIAAVSMDIKEAIDLTLRDNLALLSLRQEAVKAAAFKLQADGTSLPEVSLNTYVDAQREDQTSDGSSRNDNRVARLSLTQTVYSGGRNSAMKRQSEQVRTIADQTLISAENRAVGEIFARFYNVLLQQSRVETELAGITTSELHLREVTRMSELGLSNRLEVIRASQQLATNRANLSSAEGALDAAHISLMNYMAIPPEERRPVTGTLHTMEVSSDRAGSLAAAMNNRADRGVLETQIEYQKNQIDIERSSSKPKVTLGGSVGYLDPYRGGDYGDDTWRAELAITVPVFDRNVARSSVIRAMSVIEQDKISLLQKDLDIKSEIGTAWAELEATEERLVSTRQALELAEESLRLAMVGFQEGVTPQLDLLNAQSSLTTSRLEYQSSLYNNILAVVALKVTEGNIIEWTEGMDF